MTTSAQSLSDGVFAWQRREAADVQRIDAQLLALRSMSAQVRAHRPRVVLGVPGDDVHVVANRLADRMLTVLGYEVANLGVMVTDHELLGALEDGADAVILSSINGHALGNCGHLPALLSRTGFDVPVYLGGNLAVGVQPWPLVQQRFLDLGFRHVFSPTETLPQGSAAISAQVLERLTVGQQTHLAGRRAELALTASPCSTATPIS